LDKTDSVSQILIVVFQEINYFPEKPFCFSLKLFRFLANLNFFLKNAFGFWAGGIFLEKNFEVFAGAESNRGKGVQFLRNCFFADKNAAASCDAAASLMFFP